MYERWLERPVEPKVGKAIEHGVQSDRRLHASQVHADAHVRAPAKGHVLVGLAEKDRRAVVLRFFEQRSVEEVADLMGVSPEAAKQRIFRAIEKLRGGPK